MDEDRAVFVLDADGFNELRICRSGPMLYNRFDKYVGQSLRKYGEFSSGERSLFEQIVRPGMAVVEVGANIGAHTVELSRMAGSRGFVWAFEPQRIPFQTLCANLALNQCVNVDARQAAIGSAEGTIQVPNLDPRESHNFGGVELGEFQGGDAIALLTLDSLALPACHFLKVDVEGMELDVLRGGAAIISRFRPMLYVENDRPAKSAALIGYLFAIGYAAYWHVSPLFTPANFAGDPEDIFGPVFSINLFCCPEEAAQRIEGLPRVATTTELWPGCPVAPA